MHDDPITLPAPAPRERPAPFPVLASLAPVGAGVLLWTVTGSIYSLLFAAFGPLIALAAIGDRAWSERRRRRADVARLDAEFARVEAIILARHTVERAAAWRHHPSLASRLVSGSAPRGDGRVVIGVGGIASAVRLSAEPATSADTGRGAGARIYAAHAERRESLRQRAAVVERAPLAIDITGGVVVVGAPALARALLRSIAAQVIAADPDVRIVATSPGWEWLDSDETSEAGSGLRVAVMDAFGAASDGGGAGRAAAGGRGGHAPVATAPCDVLLACAGRGDPLPAACATRVIIDGASVRVIARAGTPAIGAAAIGRAGFTDDSQGSWFGLSAEQARRIGSERARGRREEHVPDEPPADRRVGERGRLTIALGITPDARAAVVDLVTDGPHAAVAGVTGSGKSELLIAWITRLCAAYSSSEVSFLLADFKGGSAFDGLLDLPHVTAVVTDLDPTGATRAIESLRAEIQRRERSLAAVGARDIDDPRVREPRLVIVVDEFAALRSEHADLVAVFADVAARGRALGMHLILGTQRATGTYRDELLANVPLRVGLRMNDPQDSRLLLGTDAAARLPGGTRGVGRALVQRAGDAEAQPLRVVRVGAHEASVVRANRSSEDRPPAPYLPPLPPQVDAEHVRAFPRPEGLVVGLADEPARQRRRPWSFEPARDRALLVLGGPGAGRTSTLRAVAAEARDAGARVIWVSAADPEHAWDAIASAEAALHSAGVGNDTLVAIDDLDALIAGLPDEYAAAIVARLDELLRACGAHRGGGTLSVAVSALRLSGPVSRLQDRFPLRIVLPYPQRTDAIAAGVPPVRFDPTAPAGRGRVLGAGMPADGLLVQIRCDSAAERAVGAAEQITEERAIDGQLGNERRWMPSAALTLALVRRPSDAIAALRESDAVCVLSVEEADAQGPAPADSRPVVVVGTGEGWQRHWALLARARDTADVVIDVGCAAEYRSLWGDRELLPYVAARTGAAWLITPGGQTSRIELPRPLRSSRESEALRQRPTVGRISPTTAPPP